MEKADMVEEIVKTLEQSNKQNIQLKQYLNCVRKAIDLEEKANSNQLNEENLTGAFSGGKLVKDLKAIYGVRTPLGGLDRIQGYIIGYFEHLKVDLRHVIKKGLSEEKNGFGTITILTTEDRIYGEFASLEIDGGGYKMWFIRRKNHIQVWMKDYYDGFNTKIDTLISSQKRICFGDDGREFDFDGNTMEFYIEKAFKSYYLF